MKTNQNYKKQTVKITWTSHEKAEVRQLSNWTIQRKKEEEGSQKQRYFSKLTKWHGIRKSI